MTQTTPSHGQAVEAEPIAIVNKTTCISVHRGNEVLANFAGPESHANARLFASALTSQQEVAAPVSDAEPRLDWAIRTLRALADGGRGKLGDAYPEIVSVIGGLKSLVTSRVPVASLASREQGVEAVGAVPVAYSIRGANSGTVYGEAATDQDLEVWFANHPDAYEVSRVDFKGSPTIVVIERESQS